MFRTLFFIALGVTVLGILAHMVVSRRGTPLCAEPTPGRFWRRLAYALTALSTLLLAVTGMYVLLAGHRLEGYLLMAHVGAGSVFIGALVLLALSYAYGCRFNIARAWLRAGQRVCFWCVLALGITLSATSLICMLPFLTPEQQELMLDTHRIAAIAIVMTALAHLYFSLVKKGRTG